MEWQPIETAPKDGTLVVLFVPGGVDRQGYTERADPFTIGYFGKADFTGGSDRWLSIESIMEVHDYGGMTGVSTWTEQIEIAPTHWMPLPPPPSPSRPGRR